ncbi:MULTISPECIES: RING finger protein [Acutalibacteraceae]|uniref:RING finger protein n=1 Tax=Acutalibacteraceae TaxID=3082771 RepID=UPI0013E8DBE1|nr:MULTISPECIES: RING finger protein [Acutalibacteraceae]
MTDYVGLNCPVCGKTFTAEDDIVVCPICGAPYHRHCYAEAGKCVFEEKHGTPDAWAPPGKGKEAGEQGRTKRCPRCGSFNSDQALFCEQCGQSLEGKRPNDPGAAPPYVPQNNAPFAGGQPDGNPFGQNGFPGGPPPFYPAAGIPGPNETIDGVPAGDVARFVQTNTQYYLTVFMNLKRFRRNRFNFCAFLFPGAWMLYRKLYKAGSIVTAVMFGLYIASAWVTEHFLNPIIQFLFLQTGITGDTLTPSNEQIEKLMELIEKLPSYQVTLMAVPALIFLTQLILMLVFGFSANRMYLKHCIGKITAIRKETTRPSDNAVRMQEEGGVNLSLAICLGICYFILSYIPSIFY